MQDKGNTGNIVEIKTDDDVTKSLEHGTAAPSLRSSSIRRPNSSSTTSANHPFRHYTNSHHTQVRRSSDDREEDLLLESESVEDRESHPREHGESSYFDATKQPLAVQPGSSGKLNDHFTGMSSYGRVEELVEYVQPFPQTTGNTSLQSTPIPQQESCGVYTAQNCELVSSARRPDCVEVQRFCKDPESSNGSQILCKIFVFKRGIIARDELIHALYIIPADAFHEKFPKIKQYEAVVCHGTEFPMVGEKKIPPCSLFHHILIDKIFKVHFELLNGETFSIASPPTEIKDVSEIRARSKDRIGCGFSITVLTRCTGGKDKLFEDNIRLTIQSANTTLRLIFPIASYEANISPWLHNSQEVTAMPDEDREVLRSCHVSLLENIGDVISVCEHLYQHKILDSDDLEEVRNITRKKDRNAYVLHAIQTRGNILDLVIEIMRGQRENQEAAAILQKKRYR